MYICSCVCVCLCAFVYVQMIDRFITVWQPTWYVGHTACLMKGKSVPILLPHIKQHSLTDHILHLMRHFSLSNRFISIGSFSVCLFSPLNSSFMSSVILRVNGCLIHVQFFLMLFISICQKGSGFLHSRLFPLHPSTFYIWIYFYSVYLETTLQNDALISN